MNAAPANLRQLFLRPGELFVCCEPSLVTTLLGSCVAITMFSPGKHIGAICHALLPRPRRDEGNRLATAEGYKYVSLAVPAMLEILADHRVTRGELQVKLFGGSSVLATTAATDPDTGIGALNVLQAQRLLLESNLRIHSSHVGGSTGHKLLFNTTTGEVLIKHLSHHAKTKN
jgi:chemotaxis protein CheD